MATLSKNIFWASLTSILQLYTGSVVFVVLAKMMSVEDFGILSFGYSLSAIVIIVADFGFSLMILKDFPGRRFLSSYVFNSIIAKSLIALITGLIFASYVIFFYSGEWLKTGALFIVFAIIASYIIYLQALLRAQNRFKEYTTSNVVYAVAITILIVLYWQFPTRLICLIGMLILAKTSQLLWLVVLTKSTIMNFSYIGKNVGLLLVKSWSFGLFNILGILYFMIDTQLISIFLGAKEVALYQSVFRIVLILMLFSDIMSNVLLPYFSFKFYNQENISELASRIFLYLLLAGCSIFLVFTTFKYEMLELLYSSQYFEAGILVLPFSIVLILRTISSLLGNILTISNRQGARVVTVGFSLMVCFALNIVLIPLYGIIAAAWTSVVVHLVLFGMYAFFSIKEMPSIRLLSPTNVFLLLTMFLLFVVIQEWGIGNPLLILLCIASWICLVVLIMKRRNNLGFLLEILRERGGG